MRIYNKGLIDDLGPGHFLAVRSQVRLTVLVGNADVDFDAALGGRS
jgi:hypothetical protein